MKTIIPRGLFVFLFAVCIAFNMATETPRNMLIVTDGSSFKAKTIEKVLELSAARGIECRVLNIKKIAEANNSTFDRYVILCKLTGGRVQKDARFLSIYRG